MSALKCLKDSTQLLASMWTPEAYVMPISSQLYLGLGAVLLAGREEEWRLEGSSSVSSFNIVSSGGAELQGGGGEVKINCRQPPSQPENSSVSPFSAQGQSDQAHPPVTQACLHGQATPGRGLFGPRHRAFESPSASNILGNKVV